MSTIGAVLRKLRRAHSTLFIERTAIGRRMATCMVRILDFALMLTCVREDFLPYRAVKTMRCGTRSLAQVRAWYRDATSS